MEPRWEGGGFCERQWNSSPMGSVDRNGTAYRQGSADMVAWSRDGKMLASAPKTIKRCGYGMRPTENCYTRFGAIRVQ